MSLPAQTVDERAAVSFPGWKTALAASGESAGRQWAITREVISFLHRCKQWHCPASVELARQYLAALPGQGGNGGDGAPSAREALRWFFRAARSHKPLSPAAPAGPIQKGSGFTAYPWNSGSFLPQKKAPRRWGVALGSGHRIV